MKFVDHVTIEVKAGDGGTGASTFRREKYVPMGGPDGGDGGRGGDVVLVADSKLQTLMDLRHRRHFKAVNGKPGQGKKRSGSRGEDCLVPVPRGTLVFNEARELKADLVEEGQSVVLVQGGKGGRGNQHFATPTNRAPRYAQPGLPGETGKFVLELRLIAEIGLVGLPNAGKSTLLKRLTAANPKIGAYPFTTLHPNLGVLKWVDREVVMADLPGIIKGASEGAGLGHTFLRHIDRTHFLIHLVDAGAEESESCWKNYQIVNEELGKSDLLLEKKPQIVVLSKIDALSKKEVDYRLSYFKKKGIAALPLSAHTGEGIDRLIQQIQKMISTQEKTHG